jgi:phosphatidylserine/phosphatidylglycerophosphate/cardiolipin synthase-like enzyme
MSPFLVTNAQAEALPAAASLELVPRNCSLKGYKKKTVPEFKISSDFIAYASPDSTYAVTRRLIDSAKDEIIIGIYDFSADYIKDLVLDTMKRGVTVSLMLDIDGDSEQDLFDELKKFGCKAVPAPSCAAKKNRYFSSSHEKVIVIDGLWTLVQSGNYSTNSIPFNEKDGGDKNSFVKGNRDMGVAIRSKPLAEFFAKILRSDMKLELGGGDIESAVARPARPEPDLVEAVPKQIPADLFPSAKFAPDKPIKVRPVLSPDNYMDVVPDFLRSAKKSIYIEQQYIRSTQAEIVTLLTAIKSARQNHPNLDVRIILGKVFNAKDVPKEKTNLTNLRKTFDLRLGDNIRYIDVNRFVHCHNKLIVVDEAAVLVSSQNWSSSAVAKNREAGLVIDYPALAKYYTRIFESDWKTALRKMPVPKKKGTITPEAVARGNFVEVRAADYQEV